MAVGEEKTKNHNKKNTLKCVDILGQGCFLIVGFHIGLGETIVFVNVLGVFYRKLLKLNSPEFKEFQMKLGQRFSTAGTRTWRPLYRDLNCF